MCHSRRSGRYVAHQIGCPLNSPSSSCAPPAVVAVLPDAEVLLRIALYQAQGDVNGLTAPYAPASALLTIFARRSARGEAKGEQSASDSSGRPRQHAPTGHRHADTSSRSGRCTSLHHLRGRILMVPLFFSAQFAISSFQSMPISGT